MYNFSDYKEYNEDALKGLRNTHGDRYVLELLIPGIKVGRTICSPLRVDKNPSFYIKEVNHKIRWYDYSTGDKGDLIDLCCRYYNCNYRTLQEKIVSLKVTKLPPKVQTVSPVNKDLFYYTEYATWNQSNLGYWKDYGVELPLLNEYKVRPMRKVILVNEENHYCFHSHKEKDHLCFEYRVYDKQRFYRPFDKKGRKWLGGINPYCFGQEQLKTTNTLIITSSLKDVLVLRSLGYWAIAPPSESSNLSPTLWEKLGGMDNIYLFYDYDKAGIYFSRLMRYKIERLTGKRVKELFTNNNKLKDISDYVRVNYQSQTKALLK